MLFTNKKNCSWHGMMSHRDSKFASNNTSSATVFTPESLKKLFEQLWWRRTETRSCLYLVSQKRTGWSRPLASFFSNWVRTEKSRVEAVNRIWEKNSAAARPVIVTLASTAWPVNAILTRSSRLIKTASSTSRCTCALTGLLKNGQSGSSW